jgi:hypothetical protein
MVHGDVTDEANGEDDYDLLPIEANPRQYQSQRAKHEV